MNPTAQLAPATVTELPPATRVSLRLAAPAAAAPGLALPAKVGERSADGARTALCPGPDEWLIEAPETDRDALLPPSPASRRPTAP